MSPSSILRPDPYRFRPIMADSTSGTAEQPAISPQLFHVLLSLADGARHGYGILLEVQERTGGAVSLGTGTLYSIVKRLREDGWIAETEAEDPEREDPRRRHYRLTEAGRRVLRLEAERLRALVRQAEAKAILGRARS
jgi:DNA-binding PadR family transcriptional regulator